MIFKETNISAFTKYNLPFGELGNMTQFPIEFKGRVFPTSEHLFQAMRFMKDEEFTDEGKKIIVKMISQNNPMAAKHIAKSNAEHFVVEPCSEEDIQNMRLTVLLKWQQNEKIRQVLRTTGTSIIIEDVTKRGSGGSNLFLGSYEDPIWPLGRRKYLR